MVNLIEIKRYPTYVVQIGNVTMGGGNPIIIQSMTNTDTANIMATIQQIKELADAGSELVRITVNNEAAAQAVAHIKDALLKDGYSVPLVGCFHYNGHRLLTEFPDCAQALDKYRINPGNVGFGDKRRSQFDMMIEQAIINNKAVRIGVNWGSLDQDLSAKLMDENLRLATPQPTDSVLRQALVESALQNAARAVELGLPKNKIVLSCKVSRVQDLIAVYQELSKRSRYALHVGLTEAGIGDKGVIATAAGLAILLQQGIGDTIRASLTPRPGDSRTKEVIACQEILQSLNLRDFSPQVTACPGCGRTTSTYFQQLADTIQTFLHEQMPIWKQRYPGVETMKVAVMGCIVNGPGESKHSDIGISLPGSGESPVAPVFIDGIKKYTLRGDSIAEEFKSLVIQYVDNRYGMR